MDTDDLAVLAGLEVLDRGDDVRVLQRLAVHLYVKPRDLKVGLLHTLFVHDGPTLRLWRLCLLFHSLHQLAVILLSNNAMVASMPPASRWKRFSFICVARSVTLSP